MEAFLLHYDYGTGSTYVAVTAPSRSAVIEQLRDVRIVDDPIAEGLSERESKAIFAAARPLDDKIWDGVRVSPATK